MGFIFGSNRWSRNCCVLVWLHLLGVGMVVDRGSQLDVKILKVTLKLEALSHEERVKLLALVKDYISCPKS